MGEREPTHLDAIKWPKPCATCGEMVNTTGWLHNHQLYCEKHRPVGGEGGKPTEGVGGGGVAAATHNNNTPPLSKPSLVRCANCGDMVDHVTHIIRIGNAEIDLSICDDCDWLRRAAWQLKLNGMWKPTPKREGIP